MLSPYEFSFQNRHIVAPLAKSLRFLERLAISSLYLFFFFYLAVFVLTLTKDLWQKEVMVLHKFFSTHSLFAKFDIFFVVIAIATIASIRELLRSNYNKYSHIFNNIALIVILLVLHTYAPKWVDFLKQKGEINNFQGIFILSVILIYIAAGILMIPAFLMRFLVHFRGAKKSRNILSGALLAVHTQDFDKALSLTEKALYYNPYSPQALILILELHIHHKNYTQAAETIEFLHNFSQAKSNEILLENEQEWINVRYEDWTHQEENIEPCFPGRLWDIHKAKEGQDISIWSFERKIDIDMDQKCPFIPFGYLKQSFSKIQLH